MFPGKVENFPSVIEIGRDKGGSTQKSESVGEKIRREQLKRIRFVDGAM